MIGYRSQKGKYILLPVIMLLEAAIVVGVLLLGGKDKKETDN